MTSDWDKTGAAVVAYQLLGRWSSGDRTVSSADWNTLYNRLVLNNDISMVLRDHTTTKNTTGLRISNTFDAAKWEYYDEKTVLSWKFYDGSTSNEDNLVAAFEVGCANGLGESQRLPEYSPEYSLDPSIELSQSGAVTRRDEGGARVLSGTSRVSKAGSADSRSVLWRVTRIILAKDATLTKVDDAESSNPCDAFTGWSSGGSCSHSGFNQNQNPSRQVITSDSSRAFSYNIPGSLREGQRVCFVTSVDRPTQNSTPAWRHSDARCVTIAREFNLTPSILNITRQGGGSVADGGLVDRSTLINIRHRVNNGNLAFTPDSSTNQSMRITRIAYGPSKTLSAAERAARDSTGDPCASGTFTSSGRLAGALGCSNIGGNPSRQYSAGNYDQTLNGVESTIDSRYAAGTKVCFVASVSRPTQDSTPVWRHSAMRCVEVARSFELEPTIYEFNDDSVIEPGASTPIRPRVNNDGPDTSVEVEWRITQYIYNPGSSPSSSQRAERVSTTQNPCAAFTSTNRQSCTDDPEPWWQYKKSNGETRRTFPVGETNNSGRSYTVPTDLDVGTKVCFVASVSPPTASASSSTWRHSQMYCLIVGKKPKVQVWGGDVRAGGEIRTSTSIIDGQAYGSWGEYAALSNRQNSGFATGSGLNKGSSGLEQSTWSELTFANTGINPGCSTLNFGCYGFTLASPLGAQPLVGQFKLPDSAESTLGSSVNLNSLSSGVHKRTGNISLTSATISQGKSIVLEATGTVTIEGNIRYSGGNYSSVHDIPQVVIRAPTINIEDRVERVDAWLFAVRNSGSSERGVLNTCSNRTGGLTANICNRLLTINGPVVAEQVLLRRTAGSGATADVRHEPAEIFNLRADAYLWGRGYGSHSNQVRTVHIRELAPRF